MDINCIICSDLFSQTAEVVINNCGHMFHSFCILQWLERSKTCPQCRARATEKSLNKVFFNLLSTENITDSLGTLQAKLDGANFKIKLRDKELSVLSNKYDEKEAQNIELREFVQELENRNRSHSSVVNGLKEQVHFYKAKAKENERLQSEVHTLKQSLKNMETVQAVIDGTRAEVNEILKNETDISNLALLSATLKKSLINVEQKNNTLQSKLKHAQSDIMKYKRECSNLELMNEDLRKQLKKSQSSWLEQKKYLKQKIEDLNKTLNDKKRQTPERPLDDSVHRILTESPAPLPRRRKIDLEDDKTECIASPSVEEKVAHIKDSDSPYLSVKTHYSTILDSKYSMKLGQTKSIFKVPTQKLPSAAKPTTSQLVYTGLGGQVTEDYLKFPEGKLPLKRTKSSTSSAIPSRKFRKLAPNNNSKKITDFIAID